MRKEGNESGGSLTDEHKVELESLEAEREVDMTAHKRFLAAPTLETLREAEVTSLAIIEVHLKNNNKQPEYAYHYANQDKGTSRKTEIEERLAAIDRLLSGDYTNRDVNKVRDGISDRMTRLRNDNIADTENYERELVRTQGFLDQMASKLKKK